jgi:hypothetical protein
MKKEIAQSNFLLLAASSSSFVLLYKDDGTAAHTDNIPVQKNKREQQNCQQRERNQQQLRIRTAKETMRERECSLLMLDLTKRDGFGEEIRSKDAKAESVGVVESQHTEDVSGNEEVSVELRNAHALLSLLHQLPPSQRPVAQQHGHVKRHHSHHHTVELRSCECHAQEKKKKKKERKKEFFNLSRESLSVSLCLILSKLSHKLHFS